MKSCLLLLNGEVTDAASLRAAARRAQGRIICADGGVRHAAALRVQPSFVVGDMDSLPRPLPRWRRTVYWCDFSEESNDFEKALRVAAGLGCCRAEVFGALGGQLDHELVNLAVAERWASSGFEVVLRGRGAARLLGPGRYRLPLRRGERFSLLAAPKSRVTLSAAEYCLKREILTAGSRGLGNTAKGPVHLEIHDGRTWLITG